MKVRKAVFPAAGLGTRFLPATKGAAEGDAPARRQAVIQYVVEEAVASGLSRSSSSPAAASARRDHLTSAFDSSTTERPGQSDELAQIKTISELASVSYVRQREPLGLGHAILCARALVGTSPSRLPWRRHHRRDGDALHAAAARRERSVPAPVLAVERVPLQRIISTA